MSVYVKARCPCCGDDHEVPPGRVDVPRRCFFCRQYCARPNRDKPEWGPCKKPTVPA